jgi:type II secretory pathway pseudopilin PulG
MKKRQRGMTFLGILMILIILGAAIYGGIRAVPVYLEYMEVSRAMEQVKDEHSAIETSAQMIRNSLERRWDVEDIKGLSWKEVEIKKTSEGFEVRSQYEVEQPFVANLFLLIKFDKMVVIPQ